MQQTREPQYQFEVELAERHGVARFGIMSNQTWRDDPRRLLFVLARYKFVAKMLRGKRRVLEIGCADAFATRLVLQEVGSVVATDFDPVFIDDARTRMESDGWACDLRVHDFLQGPVAEEFDAAYSLDVFEHIPPADEHRFLRHLTQSLRRTGVAIVGMPSLQSQSYASKGSREGHVNCKDGKEFKTLMEQYFDNVFLFSMNDEVVHTGFHPMAHYVITLSVGPR
jgi:cyclopropane fatty-acyl-phospholipid synthase-like methyltransferase